MNSIQDDRDIFFKSMCGLIERHFTFVDRGHSTHCSLVSQRRDRCSEYSRNIQIVYKLYKTYGDEKWVFLTYKSLLDKVCITLDCELMRQDVRAIGNVFAYPRKFLGCTFKSVTDLAISKLEKKHSRLVQIYSNYTILSIGDVFLLDIRTIIGKLMFSIFLCCLC